MAERSTVVGFSIIEIRLKRTIAVLGSIPSVRIYLVNSDSSGVVVIINRFND